MAAYSHDASMGRVLSAWTLCSQLLAAQLPGQMSCVINVLYRKAAVDVLLPVVLLWSLSGLDMAPTHTIRDTKYGNTAYLVGVCTHPHVLYPILRGMGYSYPAVPAVNGMLKGMLSV